MKEINLIAISGQIGSGKDTVAQLIHEYLWTLKIEQGKLPIDSLSNAIPVSGWETKKFAEKVKQIASLLTGIERSKFEDQEFKKSIMPPEWNYFLEGSHTTAWEPMTVREFLIRIGHGMRVQVHTDVWVNALFSDFRKEYSYSPSEAPDVVEGKWIITDLRYINEAERVRNEEGFSIRVTRAHNPYPPIDHPSERELDHWNFDYVVKNNSSLEDLSSQVFNLCKHLNLK